MSVCKSSTFNASSRGQQVDCGSSTRVTVTFHVHLPRTTHCGKRAKAVFTFAGLLTLLLTCSLRSVHPVTSPGFRIRYTGCSHVRRHRETSVICNALQHPSLILAVSSSCLSYHSGTLLPFDRHRSTSTRNPSIEFEQSRIHTITTTAGCYFCVNTLIDSCRDRVHFLFPLTLQKWRSVRS